MKWARCLTHTNIVVLNHRSSWFNNILKLYTLQNLICAVPRASICALSTFWNFYVFFQLWYTGFLHSFPPRRFVPASVLTRSSASPKVKTASAIYRISLWFPKHRLVLSWLSANPVTDPINFTKFFWGHFLQSPRKGKRRNVGSSIPGREHHKQCKQVQNVHVRMIFSVS